MLERLNLLDHQSPGKSQLNGLGSLAPTKEKTDLATKILSLSLLSAPAEEDVVMIGSRVNRSAL